MRHTLFIVLVMGFCGEATAIELPDTCPPKPIDEESAIALANTWFEKGQKHVASQEYGDAVDAFACSLRMVEHPDTLYNAFKAAILAEKPDAAIEMGTMILEVSTDDQAKTEAREFLAAAQRARQEKEQEKESETTVPVNADRDVTAADDTGIKEPPRLDKNRSTVWKTAVVSSVVGGAGLIVGGVLQGLAGAAQRTTGETHDFAEYVDAKRDIDVFQKGALVSFVSGGVFLAAGMILFLIDGKSRDEPSLSFVPDGNGFSLRGTF